MSAEFGEWEAFLRNLARRLQSPLPGLNAHRRLVPPERRPDLGKAFPEKRKLAAILALVYPKNERIHTCLIRRPTYPGVHGGQIAFPGGRVERSDRDLLHTALREAEEEVGLPQELPQDPFELTRLYIPPSGYEVVPYLAHHKLAPDFIPQESEVAEIIELPLNDLNEPDLFGEISVNSSRGKLNVPAYRWRDEIIWGATAMILAEMADLIKDIHPLDRAFKPRP